MCFYNMRANESRNEWQVLTQFQVNFLLVQDKTTEKENHPDFPSKNLHKRKRGITREKVKESKSRRELHRLIFPWAKQWFTY